MAAFGCFQNVEASHRPVLGGIPRMLLVWDCSRHAEDEEPPVLPATIESAVRLIAELPNRAVEPPPVIIAFEGEIHLLWLRGLKRVTVMCFPDRGPMLHFYEGAPVGATKHGTRPADAASLAGWLEWLRG